jgi:hypothetical protein
MAGGLLLFKEWKSHANLHRFSATKAPIAQGLLWIAIAAALLKRSFATPPSVYWGLLQFPHESSRWR